ncbi:antibiotic biosynthesis monooxygenase [Paenibacillus agaridevorans]|jgi:quinol monooxygenase YgiN|uniref:Antibiotic biosynthesis monooxygenase n=1 Tax=Paenibacillus agaridevorans TaxID=171404 RepID=A0A2R5EYG9_9BACL|nr:antibiotic biosynthesis monooxygenase family protein [Paenibacillus agaridevorans]GBG10709.1 antibiotic biosynthesis monooxygenase [Paenibacillus agaridevorans]
MDKFTMFGQLKAHPGMRDELARRMLESAETLEGMDGCLFYILNESEEDPDALWIMELWENKEAHAASLKNEKVRALIQSCMPLIAGTSSVPIRPIGGKGL